MDRSQFKLDGFLDEHFSPLQLPKEETSPDPLRIPSNGGTPHQTGEPPSSNGRIAR